MLYGNESRLMLANVGVQFDRANDKMDVWRFHERQKYYKTIVNTK